MSRPDAAVPTTPGVAHRREPHRRRTAVVAGLLGVLLCGGAVACGSPSATPPPPGAAPGTAPSRAALDVPTLPPPRALTLSGESARLEFEPPSDRHLESNQIEWTGLPPGSNDGSSTVMLPITGGTVTLAPGSPPHGQIATGGTAELSRAGRKLDFSDLTIDFDRGEVDATLDGRRVSLIHLDPSQAHREDLPNLPPEIVGLSGYLSEDARGEIHDRLGADLTEGTSRLDMELRLRVAP